MKNQFENTIVLSIKPITDVVEFIQMKLSRSGHDINQKVVKKFLHVHLYGDSVYDFMREARLTLVEGSIIIQAFDEFMTNEGDAPMSIGHISLEALSQGGTNVH